MQNSPKTLTFMELDACKLGVQCKGLNPQEEEKLALIVHINFSSKEEGSSRLKLELLTGMRGAFR
jgi:hypothetical protein